MSSMNEVRETHLIDADTRECLVPKDTAVGDDHPVAFPSAFKHHVKRTSLYRNHG